MNFYRRAMKTFQTDSAEIILLVEDHPCLCEVLATVLRRCGYRVLTATDGERARRLARETSGIDLLLGPIELPEMRREELAVWFSTVQPQARVMWTATGHHELGDAESIIEKPYIYIDAFIRKVRVALNPKPAVEATAIAA